MSDWSIRHGEFSKIMTDHVRFDLHSVELFARIDLYDGSDHARHDDAVSQVSSDSLWLLSFNTSLDGMDTLLLESLIFCIDSSGISSSLSGVEHSDDLFAALLEDLLKIDSSEHTLLELSLIHI